MEIVLGVLAVAAVIAAIFMGMQAGMARAEQAKATGEIEGVRARLNSLEADAKKTTDALDAKRKETEELKERLKDVKKRRHEEKESARVKHDIQTVREEIERETEKKLQTAREEAEYSKAQVKKLAAEVEQLKSRRVERPVEPKPEVVAKPEAPKPEPVVMGPPRPATPEEVIRAEKAEKAAIEADLRAKKKVEDAQDEVKKIRARAETDRRAFIVQKSEVELVKDKYRAIEAKLNATILERDNLGKAAWLLEKQLKSLGATTEAPKVEAAKVEAPKTVEAPKVEAPKVEAKV